MPIQYKKDILSELKEKGYSTYRLRKDKILGEATIQNLRTGKIVSLDNLSTICKILECQPGDILKYVKEEND